MKKPNKKAQCKNGHIFDPYKNTSCPFCSVTGLFDDESVSGGNKMSRESLKKGEEQTIGTYPRDQGGGKTVGIYKSNFEPVVGWLVCIEGKEQGKDYKIKSEGNSIGREPVNDIAICGDNQISREQHAEIVFDPEESQFWLKSGLSGKNSYCNGKIVLTHIELKIGDTIRLGSTKLRFVAFCGKDFRWEDWLGKKPIYPEPSSKLEDVTIKPDVTK